jgi:cytoskeletal protein CcmA (bactofilin family)
MFSKRRKPVEPEVKALPALAAAPPEPIVEVAPEPVRCANVIAADAKIGGSIMAMQDLEIAGIVRGDVECHARLIIADTGEVHGQVIARELVVEGLIEGDVEVSGRLSIGSTGRLLGDASARSVSIEEGAIVSGACSMGVRALAAAPGEPETILMSGIVDDDEDPLALRSALRTG